MAIDDSHVYRGSTIEAHRHAVERVIMAMRANLDQPLTLQGMAEIACLSPFHFNRVFHQATGTRPTQFLYALRLEAAKRLLLTTQLSVTEICFEVGYNSLGTFVYRFTQLVGLSPLRFRQMAHFLTASSMQAMLEQESARLTAASAQHCATGQITCVTSFSGIIFVGLFDARIPEGRPVVGTLLTGAGNYHAGPLPDGRYYTLAAGFPRSKEPLTYWLPDRETLLVGISGNPVLVRNGKPDGPMDVVLRPTAITNPPILVALPALLVPQRSTKDTNDLLRDLRSS